jgi:hypothetical protein
LGQLTDQALGQAGVVRLVTDALDGVLGDITLASVPEREATERAALAAHLDDFND